MDSVWVFNKNSSSYSGGIFSQLEKAEHWVSENQLSGMLTKYPLDQGVWDWACDNDMHNLKPEKAAEKKQNPNFIAGFTTASQEHYHYENGVRK